MTEQLELRTFESLDALKILRPAWDRLVSKSPNATIFNTWEWLVPWWHAYGHEQSLLVVGAYNSDEELIGLAPLSQGVVQHSTDIRLLILRLMGDGSGDSDNLSLVVYPNYEQQFVAALVTFLGNCPDRWDLCEFNTVPVEYPSAGSLLETLETLRWPRAVGREPCSVISLPDDWETYLRQLSSKERDKICYLLRRIEKRYQAVFYKCTQESDLPKCLQILFQLHEKRWMKSGKAGSFILPGRRQFYSDMARAFVARGWLEFWLLKLDGDPVAAQFAFRYRDTVFSLQEGFDPAYSTDSVGYVLRAHTIRQFISEGVRRYDFLGGQSPIKQRWDARPGVYLSIRFARPSSRGSAYLRSTLRPGSLCFDDSV